MALVIDYTSGDGWAELTNPGGLTREANPGGWDDLIIPGGTACHVRWTPPSPLSQYTMRCYVVQPLVLDGGARLFMWGLNESWVQQSAAVVSGSGNPNRFRFRKQTATDRAASPFNQLVGGTTYRVEVQIDVAANELRAAYFDLYSDSPVWDSGVQTAGSTAAAVHFRLGRGATSTTHFSISRFAVSDTYGSWIGRHASDYLSVATKEILGVWNGSSLDNAELIGLWNGTSTAPVEMW